MAIIGRVLFVVVVVLGSIQTGINAEHQLDQVDSTTALQGRVQSYDSYWFNDVYYWWPWFTDLATVVMIKLKIAIGLAAIYAFGDGYYWSKKKVDHPTSIAWDKEPWQYSEHQPASFFSGWGRRKRDVDIHSNGLSEPFGKLKFAEFLFDAMEVYDEDCRKRVVCELDFEVRSNPKVRTLLKAYKYDLFQKYRGTPPERKEDCEKMYGNCATRATDANEEFFNSGEGSSKDDSSDQWRWPR